MLSVRRSVRFGVLQLPVRGTSSAVFNGTNTCSAGLPAVCCHTLPVRTKSGVRTLSAGGTLSGFRTLSGVRTLSGFGTLSGVGTLSGGRTLSGFGTLSGLWITSGVRRLSGGGAGDGAGAAGWYGGLSDAAPVHLCEHFLVNLQQVSGLPWWLSIIMSTLTVRTLITLPLTAYQMVIIAKVSDGGHEEEQRLNQRLYLI